MSDFSSEELTLHVDPLIDDTDDFMSQAQDAVFEHAVELAAVGGFGVGTEEFALLYRDLSQRYTDVLENHLQHLSHVAHVALKALLETGMVSLHATASNPDGISAALTDSIRIAALPITAALTHVAAGPDGLWLDNGSLESAPVSARGVPFTFYMAVTPTGGADD